MEIDGTIPLVKFSTRILNKVGGGGESFSLAKNSELSWRFTSYNREKML